jgi:hypothetical protein
MLKLNQCARQERLICGYLSFQRNQDALQAHILRRLQRLSWLIFYKSQLSLTLT